MMLRKFAAAAAVVGFVFSASAELPEGYAAISYLQADELAYVDTGYAPNGATKFDATFDVLCYSTTGDHYLFGVDERKLKTNCALWYET